MHHQCLSTCSNANHYALIENYYYVTRNKVCTILKHCLQCTEEKFLLAPFPLQPIECSTTFEQIQNDLIYKHNNPDNNFKCIFNAKDHFSKLSALYPLTDKWAITVANVFINWIMFYTHSMNLKQYWQQVSKLFLLTLCQLVYGGALIEVQY